MTGNVLDPRENDEWLAALRGSDARAADELRGYLVRVLAKTFAKNGDVDDDDLNDYVQDALVRILASLDSFRGESAFTTWATAIALRVAFTQLRRRRARVDGQRRFEAVRQRALEPLPTRGAVPGEVSESRARLFAALRDAIDESLTERQRIAITSELAGIPTIDIAERLGTNQNALYKLVHDARKKLRAALRRAGFTSQAVHESLSER